ncbi:MAG: hypothetical protein M3O15_03630 [Acidobacteriota bacterium]|nr:hypothetical protein [Acidobacteriota bacterium]
MKTTTGIRFGRVLALALGAGLAATAGSAQQQQAVLGASGELYIVRTGLYGDLFPGGTQTDPGNSVLALDIMRPGVPVQHLVEPDTLSTAVKSAPSLLFEDHSNTLFLVWEATSIDSVLKLASFDGTSWTAPIEITGNPFSPKADAQLAITRDTYQETDASGQPVSHNRTVVHVIWSEETGQAGLYETFYTPVILEDGTYLGWNPVQHIEDLDRNPDGTVVPPMSLVQAPTLGSGHDSRSVVVGFASANHKRVVGMQIDVLPRELSLLADNARAHIVDIGAQLNYPANLISLAEGARAHIVDIGSAFQPELVVAIADQVRSYILTMGSTNEKLNLLADGARAHIVDIGARLSERGLRAITATSTSTPPALLEVYDSPVNPQASASPHLFQLSVTSSRSVPATVGSDSDMMFISQTGMNILISWMKKGNLLYQSSNGQSWSDPLEFKLSDGVDLSRAHDILLQRVRSHP